MKKSIRIPSLPIIATLFLGFLGLMSSLSAIYIDETLHYQGRVSVQGINFNGVGQFKFALVDVGTPFGDTATATATVDGDAVTAVNVDLTGSNYSEPPVITFGGPGSGAEAVANMDLGTVSSITVTNGGSGYTTPPSVTIAPPPAGMIHSTYWSNDGTSTSGDEPQAAVEIPVINGLYSVQLGGTAPGMTRSDGDIFFTKLHLRVWFNDGVHGFQQLTPDQPLAHAPYALQARLAESVSPGAIGGAQLANGAVTASKIAPGAAVANLQADGQSGVASGGIVLSATQNPALEAAGYVKLTAVKFEDIWSEGAYGGPFGSAATVWTGTHLFVWEGGPHGGGLYNPVTDSWILLSGSAPNAPANPRQGAKAIWTGSEVIVWGGVDDSSAVSSYPIDGGRYNPTTDTWTPIPAALPNAPAGRNFHSVVWTGSKMIVWGGIRDSGLLNTGGVFTPEANGGSGSWTPTPVVASTPSARSGHSVVWTGSNMIVWGGFTDSGLTNSIGALTFAPFPPNLPAWIVNYGSLFTGSPPTARLNASAIWTGTEMIIWGGEGTSGVRFNNGKRASLVFPFGWTDLPSSGAPTARDSHSAVWTGSEMIVFGGKTSAGAIGTGARYLRDKDRWEPINAGPTATDHRAVWTGSQMLINGGGLSRPWLWTPERQMHLYQRP